MIQWQIFDPYDAVNAIAARWAIERVRAGDDVLPVGSVSLWI